MTAALATIDTPDGPFTLLVDDDGAVLSSGWTADADRILDRLAAADRPDFGVVPAHDERMRSAAAAVHAYYAGDVTALDAVRVRQRGTPFRQRGWDALRRIRAGEPLTYAEFAAGLGRPAAVRAAASVCATNATALFVPCHRVLRTGGALGGFAWGVDVKRSLLARESASHAAGLAGTAGSS